MYSHQDWNTVILRKEQKKSGPSTQKQAGTSEFRKLNDSSEAYHHNTVSSSLKSSIVAARIANKMTQMQLATAINERVQVVQEYENGKAIPKQNILSKMSRVLGVRLKTS